MLSSAFRAARFTYANAGFFKPLIFSPPKHVHATPSDVEATITMITHAITQWKEDDPMKPLVEDALKKCVFIWDTIKLKKQKHAEKWLSDWRSLSLEDDYTTLMDALQILEHRYTMAIMSKISV